MVAISWSWIMTLAVVLGQAPAAKTNPMEAEVQTLIQRLGDDRFREREAATDQLWQFGEAAEPALRAALKHSDPEIRVRAGMVLERFEYGLYPDTSEEAAALIRQYRSGNQHQKQVAVSRLLDLQDMRTLSRLIVHETDQNLRLRIADGLRVEMRKQIAASIEAGDFVELERLLRVNMSLNDLQASRQLVTMFLLQERLPEQIAALEKQPSLSNDQLRFLLALEEARENYAAADRWAEKLDDANLPLTLAVRRLRWSDAATIFDRQVLMDGSQPFNQLAYSAIYHRLAGKDQLADERLGHMRTVTEKLDSQRWFTMEVLLLHERLEEALEGLLPIRPTMVLELRCVRQEYEKGLAIANVKPGQTYDANWFELLPYGDAGENAGSQLNRRYLLAVQAAFFLHQTGQIKDAEAIFAFLRSRDKDGADAGARWRRSELCRIQMRLNLVKQAFADAASSLEKQPDPTLMHTLFGQQGASALTWYAYLRETQRVASAEQNLQTVRMLLCPTAQEKKDEEWRTLVEALTATLATGGSAERFARIEAIAEVYLARGLRAQAITLLQQPELNGPLYIRCGDLLRQEKRYAEAIACYAKVPIDARERPLALYLQSVCQAAEGREAQAVSLRNKAMILAGDPGMRQGLLQGLQTRELGGEAARVRDVWLRTSPDLVSIMAHDLGKTYVESDPRRAGQFWEHMLVNLTATNASLNQDAAYITLPHMIHQAKAKGAILAGDKAAWQRELATCRHLLPNDASAVDELFPLLEQAGWKEELDALYKDQHVKLQALCKQYPNSARLSNSLAWMSAVARRDLDEALAQARRTLELAPDVASYLDTLAEVHFARGEYQQAVDVQRRAVEVADDKALYEERLKRFEAALAR
jgi:hypothetical protein